MLNYIGEKWSNYDIGTTSDYTLFGKSEISSHYKDINH
jgi:hypothetical protein